MALDRLSFEDSSFSGGYSPGDSAKLCEEILFSEGLDCEIDFRDFSRSTCDESCSRGLVQEVRRRLIRHLLKRLSEKEFVGKEYLAGYLRHKYRCNFKAGTLFNTFTAVSLFLGFLGKIGKSRLEEVRRQDVEGFVEHEQDRGLKISTVKTRLEQVYGFLGFVSEGGVVDCELTGRKMRLRLAECLPRAMAADDVQRLLCVRGDVRDRAMVLMLLRSGMRIGELLKTKVADVVLTQRKVLIFEGDKNGVGRVVYFSDDAKEALEAWLRARDAGKAYLFYAQGRSSMCYSSARMMFERYVDQAGLSHKGYTLHSLRHTYGTELLNAGMPLECLQQLMGHNNIEITRRYARLSDNSREAAYFKAMAIIERGETDGHYRVDHQLQEVFEEEELLGPHDEELHEHP